MIKLFKPLKSLLLDSNGEISHTKFWNNIACATATYIIVKKPDVSVEFFQWYLGLVGFQALASKAFTLWLNNKTLASSSNLPKDSAKLDTSETVKET